MYKNFNELLIKEISESEYDNSNSTELFEIDERLKYNRFVEIVAFQKKYKICWPSESIPLDVREVAPNTYLLGVDLQFIIYDFASSTVKLAMTLDSYYYESLYYKDYLIIITEVDLYFINTQSFHIESNINLPDIFTSMDIEGDKLCVHCMDDSELYVRVSGNKITTINNM